MAKGFVDALHQQGADAMTIDETESVRLSGIAGSWSTPWNYTSMKDELEKSNDIFYALDTIP